MISETAIELCQSFLVGLGSGFFTSLNGDIRMTIREHFHPSNNHNSKMLSKHLFHFAMVHDEFAKTGNIVKGLIPLFIPLLSGKEGEVFSPEAFCKEVNNAYGIGMHPYVAEDLAPKLVDANILLLGNVTKPKPSYFVNAIPSIDDKPVKDDILKIFDQFENLAKTILSNAKVNTEVDLHEEFTNRLARMSSFLDSHIHPSFQKNKIEEVLDYAFVRFVTKIQKEDRSLKDALYKAYSGATLAEVVLSIREPSLDNNSIAGKYFYIDAPILLNILGLNDDYSVKCSRALIDQIKENQGILTTTSSYIEEAKTAIKLALENHRNRGDRSTSLDLFLFRGGDSLIQARAVQNKIKESLTNLFNFNLSHQLINIDSQIGSRKAQDLKDKISNELAWYKNDLARKNDAEAVTNVIARHNYSAISNMTESNSFLVTPNESLINSSNKVLYSTSMFIEPEMTPLLSEKKLATLLWVINGGKGENISSLALISSCARAIELQREVFYKIHNFLKDLPEEKKALYEGIITNDRAMHCLMDDVGSNFSLINESNFEDSLINSRNKLISLERSEKIKLDEERRSIESKIEKAEREKRLALDALQRKAALETENEKNTRSLKLRIEKLENLLVDKDKIFLKKLEDIEISNRQNEISLTKTKDELLKKLESNKEENLKKLQIIIEKILTFITCIILTVLLYQLGKNTLPKELDLRFLKITEDGMGFIGTLTSILPLLFFWKLPDFLIGAPIKKISSKLSKKILG